MANHIWITRDYIKCTGCRRCEIACSLHHEGWIWPEASRIRVFMPFPGVEVPHFCAQCQDYPCIESCKFDALSVDDSDRRQFTATNLLPVALAVALLPDEEHSVGP